MKTMSNTKGLGAMIPMAKLYERTSRRGRRYLVGRLGDARIFVVCTSEESKGDPVWQLSLNEGRYTTDGDKKLARDAVQEDPQQ
jgi:hypothetical protein